jgi:hypothetical protein
MSAVKRAGRIYTLQLGAVMAAYAGLLLSCGHLMRSVEDQTLRALIVASPIVPIWLMLVMVMRHYRRIDEFAQRRMLEVLSLSFGVTACLITSYPFLADLGLPPLGIIWAWPVMAMCWFAGALAVRLRDR